MNDLKYVVHILDNLVMWIELIYAHTVYVHTTFLKYT